MNVTAKIAPAAAQRLIEEQLVRGDLTGAGSKQRTAQTLVRGRRIGNVLVRMGKLTVEQVEQIIVAQRANGGSFGRNALKLRMASLPDLQIAVGVEAGFLRNDPLPVAIPSGLIVARNPYAPDADKFRVLRTRLTTGISENKNSVFAVSGAHAGAGAEFVAANVAASLAQLGRTVLLIDANLRMPGLAAYYGAGADAGLSELLSGGSKIAEVIAPTIVENLDYISTGEKTLEPQALLGRAAFGHLTSSMANAYDHIIVVSADFGSKGDSEFVWSTVKQVVVVARRNVARGDELKKLKQIMRSTGTEILGAVMAG